VTRAEIVSALRALEPELKGLGVGKPYLFGSAGRDEPHPRDVDLLFDRQDELPPGFSEWADALERLERVLGRPVDLVERERIHRRIRQRVEAEKIEIY